MFAYHKERCKRPNVTEGMPSASFSNDLSGASEMKLNIKRFAYDLHGTTELTLDIENFVPSLHAHVYVVAGIALVVGMCWICIHARIQKVCQRGSNLDDAFL